PPPAAPDPAPPPPAAVADPAPAMTEDPIALPPDAPPHPIVPARPATAWGRAWWWCRHHPARAGVLTAAAASLLVGTFAVDFSGRANSTAPPAGGTPAARADAAEGQEPLKQARARADRAE